MMDPMPGDDANYLAPYLRAARSHGASFSSLLWASPDTQSIRFDALARITNLHQRTICDLGCGRGDLLTFMHKRQIVPTHYVGIEAVPELAEAAASKVGKLGVIVHADFVREPVKMFVGSERVLISGALNTLKPEDFYRTLRRAWESSAEVLAFNFLSSPLLAGVSYLWWHAQEEVIAFARTLTSDVTVLADYLDGDCTLALRKTEVTA